MNYRNLRYQPFTVVPREELRTWRVGLVEVNRLKARIRGHLSTSNRHSGSANWDVPLNCASNLKPVAPEYPAHWHF
jgi:hypothetical protein